MEQGPKHVLLDHLLNRLVVQITDNITIKPSGFGGFYFSPVFDPVETLSNITDVPHNLPVRAFFALPHRTRTLELYDDHIMERVIQTIGRKSQVIVQCEVRLALRSHTEERFVRPNLLVRSDVVCI